MSCKHNWTVKFQPTPRDTFIFTDIPMEEASGLPFEFRPITMNLKLSRKEYDFCRITASSDVGDVIQPHTQNKFGKLHKMIPVDILFNGEPIHRMLFRPDWVDYGDNRTHIQLHDIHKSLASGDIDIQRKTVQVKEIYKDVIAGADNDLVPKLGKENFSLGNKSLRKIYGKKPDTILNTAGTAGTGGRNENERRRIEQSDTEKIAESEIAIDFENITAEKAIQRLNRKFRLKTWATGNGEIVVGFPEADNIEHLVAPDDDRVWRFKDPQISHGREPIKKVYVEGKWFDEPGWGGIDEAVAGIAGVFGGGGREGMDVKSFGIAERTDIDYGTIFAVKSTKSHREHLPDIAEVALKQRMKDLNNGTVEIDPAASGTIRSHPIDLKPGDKLRMVPTDIPFDNPTANSGNLFDDLDNPGAVCGNIVQNESYLVSEVEHNLTKGGDWQIYADIGIVNEVPIKSRLDYYNPDDNRFIDDDEIDSGGKLDGTGIFESGGWYEDI